MSTKEAAAALRDAVRANGGAVEEDLVEDVGYLRAAFGGGTVALVGEGGCSGMQNTLFSFVFPFNPKGKREAWRCDV